MMIVRSFHNGTVCVTWALVIVQPAYVISELGVWSLLPVIPNPRRPPPDSSALSRWPACYSLHSAGKPSRWATPLTVFAIGGNARSLSVFPCRKWFSSSLRWGWICSAAYSWRPTLRLPCGERSASSMLIPGIDWPVQPYFRFYGCWCELNALLEELVVKDGRQQ